MDHRQRYTSSEEEYTLAPEYIDENTAPPLDLVDEGQGEDIGVHAAAPKSDGGLRSRSYQLEMFEESMKRNIVVTMDTGSGKTHIAILRMMAELDRCDPDKRLWFLAPTVSLCQQQYNVICSQLPAIQVRFLSGADSTDRWSEQGIWDAVLKNIRAVVSTHQVLYDALSHGFVRLEGLALLIFDEAHHCVESHPANKIMRDFYHPLLQGKGDECVPHILGISASPIVNSKPRGLQIIERNLNAMCKTPRIHREELLQYVHPPELKKLVYPACKGPHGQALDSLLATYQGLDISQDPYMLSLKAENTAESRRVFAKTLLNRKTYCQDQLKGMCNKAEHIFKEFGSWATNYYIARSIDRIRSKSDTDIFTGSSEQEKQYLLNALSRVEVADIRADALNETGEVSPKLGRFVDFLVEESVPHFAGLVFIERRVAAAVLCHLLSIHPRTKDLFECGTFVGVSNGLSNKATSIGDLIEPRGQKTALDDFRNGKKNLIIATSVLEEGIDISACHLVICFSMPHNLKSFVQRRGRARAMRSKFVLMHGEYDKKNATDKWQELEEEMKRMYLDDQRKLEEMESVIEEEKREFLVKSTGALLTLDAAVPHLYHFCNRLPRSQYVDLRPAFSMTEDPITNNIRAAVTLPSCVAASVRHRAGIGEWKTERMAKKDAAFEIYVALYKAGLVNDNLLPQPRDDAGEVAEAATEKQPSMVSIPAQLNPWVLLAHKWLEAPELYTSIVEVIDGDNNKLQMELFLPSRPPQVTDFLLYWNKSERFRVSIGPPVQAVHTSARECDVMRRTTDILLRSIFWARMKPSEMDFPALFAPCGGTSNLDYWAGTCKAADMFASHPYGHPYGLVRDSTCNRKPYIFKEWTREAPLSGDIRGQGQKEGSPGDLFVRVARLTKRRDFLHAIHAPPGGRGSAGASNDPPESSKSELLLAKDCIIDNLPFLYSRFALFIPSILHRIEISMLADELRKTILAPVDIRDLSLVITAISASSARESTNYQRLEFFGDSILKLCTSVQLIAEHPDWHEGYLSAKKDRVVSNSRLTRAALETGLHKFIATKAFTGLKWKPLYVSDLLKGQEGNAKRNVSTKVLADVVEALIGAAFVDGSFEKAIRCLKVFLPEIAWQSQQYSNNLLYEAAMCGIPIPAYFDDLERLIGYKFTKKSLLIEAMTHPSFEAQGHPASYQRLEFLGDSVLDYIVGTQIFGHHSELSHIQMHLARTALVNADFLAFLCIEYAIELDTYDVVEDQAKGIFHTVEKKALQQIWKFMRHHSQHLARAQCGCVQRHARLRDGIWHALTSERSYPWAKLRRLEANKFFSDIIESIIGAIYVDSHGDFSACETLTERIGILSYLRRIVDGDGSGKIVLLHPKERLGQLADTEKVNYILGLETDDDGGGDDDDDENSSGPPPRKRRRHVCKVLIKGEEVAMVGDGSSREEVQTKAAEVAVAMLLKRKGLER